MIRVYICHPYRNDLLKNIEKVKKIVVNIAMENVEKMREADIENKSYYHIYCPVSPMLAFPFEMTEYSGANISAEHGMAFCLSLLDTCEEIWVFSKEVTEGMKKEIEHSSTKRIKIVWKV